LKRNTFRRETEKAMPDKDRRTGTYRPDSKGWSRPLVLENTCLLKKSIRKKEGQGSIAESSTYHVGGGGKTGYRVCNILSKGQGAKLKHDISQGGRAKGKRQRLCPRRPKGYKEDRRILVSSREWTSDMIPSQS